MTYICKQDRYRVSHHTKYQPGLLKEKNGAQWRTNVVVLLLLSSFTVYSTEGLTATCAAAFGLS